MIKRLIAMSIVSLFFIVSATAQNDASGQLVYADVTNNTIYLHDIEADTRQRITTSLGAGIDSLLVSPNGNWVAYGAHRINDPERNANIYIRDIETGDLITQIDINRDGDLSFSPDGSQVVFSVFDDTGEGALYLADADGENARQLTFRPGVDRKPLWSPDGSVIAFLSNSASRSDQGFDIYTVRPDGMGRTRLTTINETSDAAVSALSWSPDGSQIVFSASGLNPDFMPRQELYLLYTQTREFVSLTEDGFDNQNPAWSPDGEWIAFSSIRENGFFQPPSVCLMRVDGSHIECIADGVDYPAWRPMPDVVEETD